MNHFTYQVYANWDPKAEVWVVTSDDVPGLATESESIESLSQKLRIMIPELIKANNCISSDQIHEISFDLRRN